MSLIDSATQERRYMIPAPYMYDALGNASFDAAYTLAQENGTYYLTVTADASWINAQGRQFPVTIDPSVMGVSDAIADTYIDSLYPTVNYGDSRALWARVNRISYFQCSLPSFPERAELDHAYLSVHYGYLNTVESGHVWVGAYRVTMPWQESVLTWSSATNYTTCGIDTAVLHDDYELYAGQGATLSSPDEQRFYITPVVQAWFDGSCPNYGIALKYLGGTNKSVVFKSRETESQYRPCFHYQYSMQTPVTRYIANYYDTTVASNTTAIGYMDDAVAFAQTVYLNNFNLQYLTDGNPQEYENAPVSICEYGGSNSACVHKSPDGCGIVCRYHHKNIFRISEELREDGLSDRIYTLWSDCENTVYCKGQDDHVMVDSGTVAVVCDNSNAIQSFCIDGTGVAAKAFMSITLAHELAHTLGMDDVYGETHDGADGYQCIMEFYDSEKISVFYDTVSAKPELAFCNSCKATLAEKIAALS